ncbi:MAG: DUF177 domain-containing protein, partial [Victivallaceae bacterium]
MFKISLGLLERQDIDLAGEISPAFLEFENTDVMALNDPIKYELHASLLSGGVLVNGKFSTFISSICGRCLKPLRQEMSNDHVCIFFEDLPTHELDITEDVRAEIVMSLPLNCICDDDCKGLCYKCGANLNESPCDCRRNAG